MEIQPLISAIIDSIVKVEEGRSIRNVLRDVTERWDLSREEEATLYYLTFEIFRRLNLIDQYIKLSSSTFSIKELNKELRAILRLATQWLKINHKTNEFIIEKLLATYQFYCEKNGETKKIDFNVFLSNVAKLTEKDLYKNRDQASQWSLKYSVPTWIIRKFIEQWNESFTEKVIESFMSNLPMYVRVNTIKTTLEEIMTVFDNSGIEYTQDKDVPTIFKIISTETPIPRLKSFKSGEIVIQQKASSIPAYVLSPQPKERILDMCASPGGKTSQIAALSNNSSEIVAVDINKNRVKILKDRLKLLGVRNVKVLEMDARYLHKKMKRKFDKILLDPPCTSSGTYSSRPEIKWRLKKRDIRVYTRLQRDLLEAATNLIKEGGVIVYSTCSLFKEENHDIITDFINAKNDEFILEEARPMIGLASPLLEHKAQELYPHIHETEGFFIAKLRKL